MDDDPAATNSSDDAQMSSSSGFGAGPNMWNARKIFAMGQQLAAAYFASELSAGRGSGGATTDLLDDFLNLILNPEELIDNTENIDWCKWLIAGGRTPSEFATIGECIILLNYDFQIFVHFLLSTKAFKPAPNTTCCLF